MSLSSVNDPLILPSGSESSAIYKLQVTNHLANILRKISLPIMHFITTLHEIAEDRELIFH